jgi:hypothetical protein
MIVHEGFHRPWFLSSYLKQSLEEIFLVLDGETFILCNSHSQYRGYISVQGGFTRVLGGP